MFDTMGDMGERRNRAKEFVTNTQQPPPPGRARRPAELTLVIARLVHLDRSEDWTPAIVMRWTASLVLVAVAAGDTYWLSADDVRRVIRQPAAD